jgi:hypothetical protein
MKEREGSSEGQQNRGSAWREAHYSFGAVASRLGIPQNMWEHPDVRQFVDVNRQVNILQEALGRRTERQSGRSSGSNETPSIDQRYYAVSKLARVAEIILKDGLEYNPIAASEGDRRYVGELVTSALERLNYGMKVVDTKDGQQGQDTIADNSVIDVPSAPVSEPKQHSHTPKD